MSIIDETKVDDPEYWRAQLFESARHWVEHDARRLVERAERLGLVLTIEQRPLQPLAMGNYEAVVSVRPARSRY